MKILWWLLATKLAVYQLLCLTHTVLYTGKPSYLADLVHPFSTRIQRSANFYNIDSPSSQSIIGHLEFSISAPPHWKKLALRIRSCHSLTKFKKLTYAIISD